MPGWIKAAQALADGDSKARVTASLQSNVPITFLLRVSELGTFLLRVHVPNNWAFGTLALETVGQVLRRMYDYR